MKKRGRSAEFMRALRKKHGLGEFKKGFRKGSRARKRGSPKNRRRSMVMSPRRTSSGRSSRSSKRTENLFDGIFAPAQKAPRVIFKPRQWWHSRAKTWVTELPRAASQGTPIRTWSGGRRTWVRTSPGGRQTVQTIAVEPERPRVAQFRFNASSI